MSQVTHYHVLFSLLSIYFSNIIIITIIALVLLVAGLQLHPSPEGHSHLGLYNQGATCYLNSILQTLFYDDWFRNAVMGFAPTDGSELPPLVRELQRLFAFLLHSENGATSASDLISTFGWTRSQVNIVPIHPLSSLLLRSILIYMN